MSQDEHSSSDLNSLYRDACRLKDEGRLDEAKTAFKAALDQKPDCWEAYFHLGCIYFSERTFQEAADNFKQSISINSCFYYSFANLGLCYANLNRNTDAIAMYRAAISIEPNAYFAHFNLANVYSCIGKTEDAISELNLAIDAEPSAAEAIFNLANVLVTAGRMEDAIKNYEKAISLKPDLPGCYGQLIHAKMLVCDWSNLEQTRSAIFRGLELGQSTCAPFVGLSLTDSIRLQRMASATWAYKNYPSTAQAQSTSQSAAGARIRVGYFSMDYRDHPVSTLMAGVIEAHDRTNFEVFAFSYGKQTGDAMRSRMENAFDHFLDVSGKSDWEIQAMARARGIDIGVDLAGYTTGSRPGIMALRPAPIQVSFLGFVGSQGVNYLDYLIADPIIVPEHLRDEYSEKIVYLPWFQPNDGSRLISDRVFARDEHGLTDEDFVFCCFNHSYKFTPEVYTAWMEILRACAHGKLLLLASNATTETNLRREALSRGIDPNRLVFVGRVPPADYLARYRMADLFLDTMPYNSGTTASDALWAGLPVLTCAGEAFASRMAASLLTALGVPELITTNLEEYVEKAITLANAPKTLARIRSRMNKSRTTKGLYDAKVFTKNLEAAFVKMYDVERSGSRPEHISVIGHSPEERAA